jgi:ABC-type nitrate/sulfonate/bicarbonate transport system permease component
MTVDVTTPAGRALAGETTGVSGRILTRLLNPADRDETSGQRSRRLLRKAGLWAIGIAIVPALWALLAATGWLGPGFIGPAKTVNTLYDQWDIIWYNAGPTIGAAIYGAAILLAVTLVGALVVAVTPGLTSWLVALSVVVGSLPLVTVTPALSLFVSRGSELVTTVTFLSGLVPVAATLAVVSRTAQAGRQELGAVYATSRLRWFTQVGFWRSIPVIDIGLRTMLPACFVGAIVAEWSGASGDRGLGGLMANALFSYQVGLLWATLLLAAAVSIGLMGAVGLLMEPLRRRVR